MSTRSVRRLARLRSSSAAKPAASRSVDLVASTNASRRVRDRPADADRPRRRLHNRPRSLGSCPPRRGKHSAARPRPRSGSRRGGTPRCRAPRARARSFPVVASALSPPDVRFEPSPRRRRRSFPAPARRQPQWPWAGNSRSTAFDPREAAVRRATDAGRAPVVRGGHDQDRAPESPSGSMREACRRSSCQNPIPEAARPDSYTEPGRHVAAAGLRRVGVLHRTPPARGALRHGRARAQASPARVGRSRRIDVVVAERGPVAAPAAPLENRGVPVPHPTGRTTCRGS